MSLFSNISNSLTNQPVIEDKSNGILNVDLLHKACSTGDITSLKSLLKDSSIKSLINTKNKDGLTPIMTAVLNGHKLCVKLLIENKADLTITDNKDQTVLHSACKLGLHEIVDIIGHNINIDSQIIYNEETALITALRNGKRECAKLLIKNGADINIPDNQGLTALHIACEKGFDDIVNFLIAKGAKLNIQSKVDKWTPLQTAIYNRKSSCAELLIKNNAEIDITNPDGWTLLHLACKYGYKEIIKLIANRCDLNAQIHSTKETALHIALLNNNLECAKILINNGANPIISDSKGLTPLHIASDGGYSDILSLLIPKVKIAELDIQSNNSRQTPLHLALSKGKIVDDSQLKAKMNITKVTTLVGNCNVSCAKLLIKNGADLDIPDSEGRTSLHIACENGLSDVVKLLIENRVNTNVRVTSSQQTALHIAISKGNLECARLLIENDADVNVKDNEGWTPLHFICANGNLDLTESLLGRESVINAQTAQGYSPLMVALNNGSIDCAALLISNGANIELATNDKLNAIHIACENKLYELVVLLIDTKEDLEISSDFTANQLNTLLDIFKSGYKKCLRFLLNCAEENLTDDSGSTPLHIACELGWNDIVQIIIDKKAYLNSVNYNNETALIKAICSKNRECAKLLIEKGVDVSLSDNDGFTPLHHACINGFVDIVQMLIERRVDIDKTTTYTDETPLITALTAGNTECAKLLIINNANLTHANFKNWSPLQLACWNGFYDIVELILEKKKEDLDLDSRLIPSNQTALHTALSGSKTDCARLLMNNGVDLMAVTQSGQTPLHIVCLTDNVEFIAELAGRGVDLNMQDVFGNTPLILAIMHQSLKCAEFLINNGADLKLSANSNFTALDYTLEKGMLDMAKLLIDKGAELGGNNKLTDYKAAVLFALYKNGCNGSIKFLINTPYVDYFDINGNTLLSISCENGYLGLAKLLIDRNVNLNIATRDYHQTALIKALNSGSTDCAKLLIDSGCDVDIPNSDGKTPLHIACERGYDDIVQLLIDKKAKLDLKTNFDQDTPLIMALEIGSRESAKLLIENGADPNMTDGCGQTALYIACKKGYTDIAKLLIDKKVNLDIKTEEIQKTALIIALENGNIECVRLLVENGADPNMTDDCGQTQLYIACKKGYTDIVKLLIDKKVNLDIKTEETQETALIIALENGNIECAKLLIESGADINAVDAFGWTALHRTCNEGYVDIAKMLLEKNANPNTKLHDGNWTPLQTASETGFDEIVKMLLERNVEVDFKNNNQITAFHLSVIHNRKKCAELLLEHKANIDEPDSKGETPLHIACSKGNYEMVEFLVNRQAKLNLSTDTKETPLHYACKNDQIDIVRLLVERGALLDIQDIDNKTPLIKALESNSKELVHLLIESGANVENVDKYGYVPIHYVCRNGWVDTLNLFISKGAKLDVLTKNKDSVLHIALKNHHQPIAQFFISNNICIDQPNIYGIRPIHTACENGLENIVRLLMGRVNINAIEYSKKTPLHLSINGKHVDCTRILIENGAELTDNSDSTGNSHFSLLLRHLDIPFHRELAFKILPNANLKKSDSLGNTPLHYAVLHKDRELIEHVVSKIEPQDLISKNIYFETPWVEQNSSEWLKGLTVEEYALLEMNVERMKSLLKDLPKEESRSKLKFLKDKYKTESEDFLENVSLQYEINSMHFENGVEKIPNIRARVNLNDFLALYDDLISKPAASIIPKNYRDRRTLETLISRVTNRTAYSGTPNDKELLELFYKPIDSALSHVLKSLQSLKDDKGEKVKIETLRTLLKEGIMCGGKISAMATNLYYTVTLRKKMDLDEMISFKLAKFREYLIDASLPRHTQNVHDRNLIMHKLGVKLGIPGGKEIKDFEDPYVGHGVDTEKVEKGFFRRYTNYTIVDAIRKELKEDKEFRNAFVEFIESDVESHERWDIAFDALVKTKGKLSGEIDVRALQEKIVKAIKILNSDESIDWDNLNNETQDIFDASQKLEVDLEVIATVLEGHNVLDELSND